MIVLNGSNELRTLAMAYRASGLTVGLCHGCFDIVHFGHIHHLRQASSLVDRLLVSITADEFIDKGPDRPIFSERIRAEIVASIRYCDHVIVNRSATAELIISAIQPDVFFKGADYRSGSDARVRAERVLVESAGGRLIFTDDAVMDSTSRIARAIMSQGE